MMKRILVSCLFLCCSLIASAYNLPQLGTAGSDGLSLSAEKDLGQQFITQIRRQLPMLHDPLIVDYVQQLGANLVAHSNAPQRAFQFFVVKDNSINAFAGPGGYIGVNSGLILSAQSEGELAAVMAHEIAHVTQRHIARTIAAMKRAQIANIAAVLAAVVLSAGNAQAGAGLASAASAGSIQSLINYTRAHEKEADRAGMQTLANAGYAPSNMAKFFEHLQQEARLNDLGKTPELLSTHPLTTNRLAEAESLSHSIKVKHLRPDNPEFYLVKARTLVLTNNNPNALARKLKQQLNKTNRLPTRYAYALALSRANHPQQAYQVVTQLLSQQPKQIFFLITEANLLQQLHKPQQALKVAEKTYQQNPTDMAALLQYAVALIQNNQSKKAANLLTRKAYRYDNNPIFLSVLAKAQGKSGQLAQAYETRAQLFLLNFNNKAALTQLQQALKFAKDRYTKARINHKINEIEHEQSLNKQLSSRY